MLEQPAKSRHTLPSAFRGVAPSESASQGWNLTEASVNDADLDAVGLLGDWEPELPTMGDEPLDDIFREIPVLEGGLE